jgi:hypothetical protein
MNALNARIGELFETLLTLTIGASCLSAVLAIAVGA